MVVDRARLYDDVGYPPGVEVPPNDKSEDSFQVLKQFSKVRKRVHEERQNFTRVGQKRLSDLVRARRGCGASNPRDIVYAHIGMAALKIQGSSAIFDIDYNKSVAKVYAEMAHHILMETKNVFVILERRYLTPSPLGLSSWVPDWSRTWDPTEIQKTDIWHVEERTMRLEALENGEYALLLDVRVVAEVVQIGSSIQTALDISKDPGTKSFHDYIPLTVNLDDIEASIDPCHGLRSSREQSPNYDKLRALRCGFENIMEGWASAIGLTDQELLPYEDISDLLNIRKLKSSIENFCDNPFAVMISYYLNLLNTSGRRDENLYLAIPPRLEFDRVCTIKLTPQKEGSRTAFQILAVPRAVQLGDVIVSVTSYISPRTTLLALRPFKAQENDVRNLPPTYQVVGTFRIDRGLKSAHHVILSDRIALV
ncbi:hypothetical protein ONS95_001211 [Cadophora gregata]|uniref:uncharacterized protein n=1 Tax=Cadophora gregata TaxID=51156 RepID=UPI0026DACF89|nr:uncharacterized protein ONS95_001211 [Cadophora gregata]KAK0129276.1 hypothetical protein ONS95_001211 [Cadophora gregata]